MYYIILRFSTLNLPLNLVGLIVLKTSLKVRSTLNYNNLVCSCISSSLIKSHYSLLLFSPLLRDINPPRVISLFPFFFFLISINFYENEKAQKSTKKNDIRGFNDACMLILFRWKCAFASRYQKTMPRQLLHRKSFEGRELIERNCD